MSDLNELSQSNIEFGVDLYKKLSASDPDSNIFFSPISLSLALAMTILGARGNTESEMKSVLKFDRTSEEKLHPLFKQLIDQFHDSNAVTLHIANKLYGEKSFSFLSEYLNKSKEFYGSSLESMDFKNKARECEASINKWVESKTNNKIKNLISSGSLSDLTRLILVNAIYFKGTWKIHFKNYYTRENDFYVTKECPVKVPLMHVDMEKFNYCFNDFLNTQVLELPYKGSFSFLVILPDLSKTTMLDVESKLTGSTIHIISKDFKERYVNVWLPRINLESNSDVKEKLQELGMVDLFKTGSADFSGMDGSKNLYVSEILHKAYIGVDEEGTEAASATAVKMCFGAGMPRPIEEEPVNFRADHPFIFLIKDNRSGAVLFMGKFMKP